MVYILSLLKQMSVQSNSLFMCENNCFKLIMPFLLWLWLTPVAYAVDDYFDMNLQDLMQVEVEITSGIRQRLGQAPAVATVITSEDIRAIGARDLNEVLETVPGLHVVIDHQFGNPKYAIRGMVSTFNPEVLVLINGISIKSIFVGNRGLIWGGMPVEAIERIEVIRGPGSAIYGSDAFSGVINIITKSAIDINHLESGIRYGSFDTKEAWVLAGDSVKGLDMAFIAEYRETDGHQENIDSDLQTLIDNALVPLGVAPVSLAPDSVNLSGRNWDFRLDLAYQNWQFRAGYQKRRNIGSGAGVAQALDPHSRYASNRWNYDLTYHNPEVTENWDILMQLSYLSMNQEVDKDLVLFPPGAFAGAFPEGVIGNPEVFEQHYRFKTVGLYSGFDKHLLRFELGYTLSELYKVKESKNFFITDAGAFVPLGATIDFSDTALVFLTEGDRINRYISLQDQWSFIENWELTTGIRYDNYSDFGETINPRMALVWNTTNKLTTKLLYGEAFRAPSFNETRAINNPVALGNPNLDPETIRMLELAFYYQAQDNLQLGFNTFYYIWEDIIQFVADSARATTRTAQNAGKQIGYGFELEALWQIQDNLRLQGNYAYQKSKDDETNKPAGNTPNHQIYLRLDWKFLPQWQLNTQMNWVGSRERRPSDNRDKLDEYTKIDITLRRTKIAKYWGLALAVRNLLDEDIREPSPVGNPSAGIPNDIPLAGRSIFGELRFSY